MDKTYYTVMIALIIVSAVLFGLSFFDFPTIAMYLRIIGLAGWIVAFCSFIGLVLGKVLFSEDRL